MIVLKKITFSLILEPTLWMSSLKVGGMLLLTALHTPSIRGARFDIGVNSGAMASKNLFVNLLDVKLKILAIQP